MDTGIFATMVVQVSGVSTNTAVSTITTPL